ncbi:hypothetical protein EDB86DRAFT_2829465 [Lactarius hatsudake]|nr:hypothetical protein EDB86DRAFT_2829465 [Lactarius hatsudake]
MSHLLNLSKQDRQIVINNLLLMRMDGSECGDGTTPQINAIGLDFAPSLFDPTPAPSPLSLTLTVTPVDGPPPRPPRSLRRPSSPKIAPLPPPIVEDNNTLRGGIATSVTNCDSMQTYPTHTGQGRIPTTDNATSTPTHEPIFLANAFERPHDPDEVAPQTP